MISATASAASAPTQMALQLIGQYSETATRSGGPLTTDMAPRKHRPCQAPFSLGRCPGSTGARWFWLRLGDPVQDRRFDDHAIDRLHKRDLPGARALRLFGRQLHDGLRLMLRGDYRHLPLARTFRFLRRKLDDGLRRGHHYLLRTCALWLLWRNLRHGRHGLRLGLQYS